MLHGPTFPMPPSRSTNDLSEFSGPSCLIFAYGLTHAPEGLAEACVSEMLHSTTVFNEGPLGRGLDSHGTARYGSCRR